VAFGTRPLPDRPEGVTFVLSPDQPTMAGGIYNASTVYLQPSLREGFGLCAVEAMACGCALVTTANGGSDDYAQDGETALVCGDEVDDMADAVRRLVRDDALRTRLAVNGAAFVERFRWSSSAQRLAELADAYLAEPDRFRAG
jgi:glycosyltransferase involved in cell wall biosynthesis